jgi:hypothetical protein
MTAGWIEPMIRTLVSTLLTATLLAAVPAMAQQPRPDTEFCAKMRKQDPGGICSAKGEYVTPDRVYLPDGRIINRTTG